ncbi:MAG TPA: PsbP-related protein [Candidatus Paceibacterota bacterium]|jgi:hypothetical protein
MKLRWAALVFVAAGVVSLVPGAAEAATLDITLKTHSNTSDGTLFVGLFDAETSDFVKGIYPKNGKARFVGLAEGRTYLLSVTGNWYEDVFISIPVTKNKVNKKVALAINKDDGTDFGVIPFPLNAVSGTPVFRLGEAPQFGVSVAAPSGTVRTYLMRHGEPKRYLLSTTRHIPGSNLYEFKDVRPSTASLSGVTPGGGYYLASFYTGDDGKLKLTNTSRYGAYIRVEGGFSAKNVETHVATSPASRNTYVNETYGFSMSFPQSWKHDGKGSVYPSITYWEPGDFASLRVWIIRDYPGSANTALDSYVSSKRTQLMKDLRTFKAKEVKGIVVNGAPGRKLSGTWIDTDGSERTTDIYVLYNKGRLIEITATGLVANFSSFEEEVKEALRSFTFI